MLNLFKTSAKNLILTIFSVIFIFTVAAFPVKAQIIFNSPSTRNNVTELTDAVVNWFLGITAGLTILFLIVGGIYYLTAFGDDKRMQEGKKIITYAIYGLILILISYSVVLTLNAIIFE